MRENNVWIRTAFAASLVLLLAGCVTAPRNYVSAGFNSSDEVRPYASGYLYFASKLTPAEWNAFYGRFPEYFKDVQTAKQFGSMMEYHPWYVAYAFRWTTLQKRDGWDPTLIGRLERGESRVGDDIFQLIYAKGPPARLIWDNDAEVLLYMDDTAFVVNSSQVSRIESCPSCASKAGGAGAKWTTSTDQVLKVLGIRRPSDSARRLG